MIAPAGVSPTFWRLVLSEPLSTLTVVDVGTGTGRLALGLAAYCRRVVGIDRDAAAIEEARRRAVAAGLGNVELLVLDAEAVDHYRALAEDGTPPDLIVAHLCVSDRIIDNSARSLDRDRVLALVGFHADQWRETGRRSRFAYDEDQMRRVLGARGFAVEHLEVEREVQEFDSVEAALAAAVGLQERWKADGRWFHYVRFLEQGGRTLTRSHLVVKARKT
ncbi:MAG TPA: class I SAM-dependent methyltransferase [Methylomirabilota bacterium]|nr:class I SAM-dependent methyltransferase [Methylomirabilota bacterium]